MMNLAVEQSAKQLQMRRLTIFCLLLANMTARSQDVTFSSNAPDTTSNAGVATSTIDVQTGWGDMNCQTFGIKSVHLSLSGDILSPFFAFLTHGGDTVQLFCNSTLQNSSSEAHLTFSMLYKTIALSEAPYVEPYSPMGNFGEFNSGSNPNGDWTLVVHEDVLNTLQGVISGWNITFGTDSLFCPTTDQYSDHGSPFIVCDDFNTVGSNGNIQNDSLLMSLGCLASERLPSWLQFNVAQSGSLSFFLHSATDNDFVIWQLNGGMPIDPPLRCSYVIDGGLTGLSDSATINEDTMAVLPSLDVQAGEQYLMLVNNQGFYSGSYSGEGMPFYVELTGDAILGCDIALALPIEQLEAQLYSYNGVTLDLARPSTVQVMDIAGRTMFGPAQISGRKSLNLPVNQVYVVRINGKSYKVLSLM